MIKYCTIFLLIYQLVYGKFMQLIKNLNKVQNKTGIVRRQCFRLKIYWTRGCTTETNFNTT